MYHFPDGWPNDNWTQVELFRLAHGRLPNRPGDAITQKTLDAFSAQFDRGRIVSRTTDLKLLRVAVALGFVKLTPSSATEQVKHGHR